ncbi:MAG: histidine phosphatase family protein [Candidatus Woesearchaeota archaeon]
MEFYLIRHPHTEFNMQGRIQGHADSPLTKESILLAQKIGHFLKDEPITKIYSSDLGRCVQTSKIISQILQVEIVKTKQLREQNLGDLNGQFKDQIATEYNEHDPYQIATNGESWTQMKERILQYLIKLQKK